MSLKVIQIDAFAEGPFSGNPAAVIYTENALEDNLMQSIAEELNLSETAFVIPEGKDFSLRWFTPVTEVRLCGHATLATAHAFFTEYGYEEEEITFHSLSGPLKVKRVSKDTYEMDFPADQYSNSDVNLDDFFKSTTPKMVYKGSDDYLAIFDNESQIRGLDPDLMKISQLDSRGLLVTAPGDQVDFVSRGYFPQCGVNEDPATGSAHCLLTKYWSDQTGRSTFKATQLSKRKGHFECKLIGDRVILKGKAQTTLRGEILI